MWAGKDYEQQFVGAGRPDKGPKLDSRYSVTLEDKIKAATDNINSATSNIEQLQKRITSRRKAGKNTDKPEAMVELQNNSIRTYQLLIGYTKKCRL